MTREEIIKLAREAGIPDDNIPALAWGRLETGRELLERFAALVAAAEREQCALAAWEIVQYEVHADLADRVAQAIRTRSQT